MKENNEMILKNHIIRSLLISSLFIASSMIINKSHSFLSSTAYAQENNYNKKYEKARSYYHNRNFTKSISLLKSVLRIDPEHLLSRILLAEIHAIQGDGAAAETELQNAEARGADKERLLLLYGLAYSLQSKHSSILRNILPGNRGDLTEAKILNLRGQAYFGLRQIKEADESFTAALKLKPKYYAPLLGRAEIATYQKEYLTAIALIDKSLEYFKGNAAAWVMKTIVYKSAGQNNKALKAVNKALALAPNHIEAHILRASLYIAKLDYKKAQFDVDAILKTMPFEPQSNYFNALIKSKNGDFKGASENLMKVVETLQFLPIKMMNNNPIYYYLSGISNYKLSNFSKAKSNLYAYSRRVPQNMMVKRILGALELQTNNPFSALIILKAASKSAPKDPTIMMLLGQVYLKIGKNEKAYGLFKKAADTLPNINEKFNEATRGKNAKNTKQDSLAAFLKNENHIFSSVDIKLFLARSYQTRGEINSSLYIIENLKKYFPKNSYFHSFYASLLTLKNNHKQARISLKTALQINPNNISALIQLANMDKELKEENLALISLQNQLKKHPKNIEILIALGDLTFYQKKSKRALRFYQKAFAIDNESFKTLKVLIQAHIKNNDTKSAIRAATSYSNNNLNNAQAFNILGDLYKANNEIVKAITAYKIYASHAFNRGIALEKLAQVQMENNEYSQAETSLRKALSWDHNFLSAHYMLFTVNMKLKDWKKVERTLRKIKKLSPITTNYDIMSGDYYLLKKEFPKALAHYKTALSFSHSPKATIGLVKALTQIGRKSDAITALEEGLKNNPMNIELSLSLGEIYKTEEQKQTIINHINLLLKKFPEEPLILNYIANAQYDLGQINKAIISAQKALKLLPEDSLTLDSLAWIYTRSGAPEKALPFLRNALIKNYNSADIKFHLAITLDMLGRRTEAIQNMAEVAQRDNKSRKSREAQKIIRRWLSETSQKK